tara:strand:- start:1123 stop:1293 length:171 start_codon:yes stop_codon:yes gene_type:complete
MKFFTRYYQTRKNRKILLLEIKVAILERNVFELQSQLTEAYKRIAELITNTEIDRS